MNIAFDRRLTGHSDADVVLHAVTDAVLGAAGLGDIGERFPDTDPALRGADSRRLLAAVIEDAKRRGWAVVNVDLVIHAEAPKFSPHKTAMREVIARLVDAPADCVSVKAKTNETTDAVGRGEAIACTCVVGLTAVNR